MNWFLDQRTYSRQVLGGWGMTVGELPYSPDNEHTLRCLVELIGQRQRDLEYRNKAKEDINALQFEKEKYRSYMEQGQRTIEEHLKRIGTFSHTQADWRTITTR